MRHAIVHVAFLVRDYDEAIEFYTKKLHFTLVEDAYQPEQDKRWVVVSPPGSSGTTLCLPELQNLNRKRLWEIKQVEGFFYFSILISGVTIMKWFLRR